MSKTINLRQRLKILERTTERSQVSGAVIEHWSEIREIWGRIDDLTVNQFIASAVEKTKLSVKITIRKPNSITPANRIKYGEIVYKIHGMMSDKETRNQYSILLCELVAEKHHGNK